MPNEFKVKNGVKFADNTVQTTAATLTGVTATAPVASSGGTAPVISMAAATASVNGYMTSTYASKLDGIAAGATANTGTVTSVALSGGTTGLTTSGGPITTSGTITLAGTLAVANGGTGVTTSTGSGSIVLSTSPSLTTPAFDAETYSSQNISAGTNAQGQGAITKDNAIIVSAPNNPSGVTLPSATTGRCIIVVNVGANPVTVYPASGGQIDALGANAAITLPVNQWIEFNAGSGTQWYSSANALVNTSALAGTIAIAKGGTGATTAAAARTGLGATTLGANLFTLANVAAIAFPRINADNTVSSLDAATFRTAIGAGTSSTTGTVTSIIAGTGLSGGTISTTGTIALANTTVTAGSYTLASITVDAQGRITAASNGSAGGGGVTSFSAGTTGLTPNTATTGAITLAGTLAIANGGTGATTRQDAMDALAGAVTSGSYLRGNGTDVVMSAIQAADVPTLNQNTTGTAANVTGTVAIANGGTGATTAAAARTALGLTAVATTALSSGGGAGIAQLNSDGTFEISRYIDFHAAGGDAVDYTVRLDGGAAGSTTLSLVGSFSASGNVTAYSDERLKTAWTNLPVDFVERLAKIKSGTYTRTDTGERQAGSSAQNWQALLPEVVVESESGTLALAYGNAALVSAVELAKEVVELKARLAKLEALLLKD